MMVRMHRKTMTMMLVSSSLSSTAPQAVAAATKESKVQEKPPKVPEQGQQKISPRQPVSIFFIVVISVYPTVFITVRSSFCRALTHVIVEIVRFRTDSAIENPVDNACMALVTRRLKFKDPFTGLRAEMISSIVNVYAMVNRLPFIPSHSSDL